MSLNAYLYLKGAQQGDIKGSVKQKGRENQIAMYAVRHEIIFPGGDTISGQATGKRQHKPLVIIKEIDKSSPLLKKALITSENITEFILRFYAPSITSGSGSGVEVQIYTIRLTNARIIRDALDMQLNKMEPGDKLPVLEEVAFSYQKIEWTWADGGIIANDDWGLQL